MYKYTPIDLQKQALIPLDFSLELTYTKFDGK